MTDVELNNLISSNSTAIAAGIGGVAVGGALGAAAGYRAGKKKSRKRKSKSSNRKKRSHSSSHKSKRKLKFGSPAYRKKYLGKKKSRQKRPHTAGKRKDTSHRRIRYTSKNQPYIIKSDGRAQFIKKKSAKSSKKRKGGRY